MSSPDSPLISIGEVVDRLRAEFPDVSASMLRFFEREGLVVPRRTPGGHRLYGEAEIERLRRLRRLQRDERLTLAEARQRLDAAAQLPPTPALARSFLRAALDGRAMTARLVILNAAEAGLPLDRLHREVLAPALHELGARWAAGTLSVAQEHEVAALARDVLGELAGRVPDPESPRAALVAACAPGELHDLGLRMVATELRERGYAVHFLGADVPPDALAHAVRTRTPRAMLLSITRPECGPALGEAIAAARRAAGARAPRILVGGQAAAALAPQLAAWHAEVVEAPSVAQAVEQALAGA
ncbi:MAG TPA: cobalamin-dependent protein [Chloroflexota bacterium]|nr:cobalamin-dependent protein [Chloroflexota bacterium]